MGAYRCCGVDCLRFSFEIGDMTPRFPWRITACLGAIAALIGLWVGWTYATLSETDVINAAAAHYVETDRDARPEHCVAQPGTDPIWITVICGPSDGRAMAIYQADRFGRLTKVPPARVGGAARS